MKIETRLSRLENVRLPHMLAFFSFPRGLSDEDQKQVESQLWSEYLEQGGKPQDTFAKLYNLAPGARYLCTMNIIQFKHLVMNKSKNPAEI